MNVLQNLLQKTYIAITFSFFCTVNALATTDSVSVQTLSGLTTKQNAYVLSSCPYSHFNTGMNNRLQLYDNNYSIYFGNTACPPGTTPAATVTLIGYDYDYTSWKALDFTFPTYVDRWAIIPYYFYPNDQNYATTLAWNANNYSITCGENTSTLNILGQGYSQSFYICIRRNHMEFFAPDSKCFHPADVYLSWTLYCMGT